MTDDLIPSQQLDASDTAFFGHPRGLGYIVAAEVGLAFSYYGIVSILTLYMTQQLFTPGHVENVFGFAAYSQAMQGMFGKMTPLALASQTFGLVTGLNYATAIVGGLLGDRWMGQRRAVITGLVIQTLGYGLLITEAGFLIALALVVIGSGLVKTNLLGQIGRLYSLHDSRRTRAFGFFLIAVNIGGFLTPLVVGTLGEKVGWAQGLAAAAVGIVSSLTIYLAGRKHLPKDTHIAEAGVKVRPPPLTRTDGRVIAALAVILIASILNAGTYNQAFNIFPVWAKAHVDRAVFGFEFPVTWFSALDGVLTIAGIAVALRLWAWQAKRGAEPKDSTRVAIGCLLTSTAFLMLTFGSMAAGDGKVALIAPLAFFLLADAALPWIDTVIQSLISRVAPPGFTTTMLGIYFLTYTAGNFLVGTLGRFYESMSPVAFWGTHAAIIAAPAVLLMLSGGWLSRLLTRPAEDVVA